MLGDSDVSVGGKDSRIIVSRVCSLLWLFFISVMSVAQAHLEVAGGIFKISLDGVGGMARFTALSLFNAFLPFLWYIYFTVDLGGYVFLCTEKLPREGFDLWDSFSGKLCCALSFHAISVLSYFCVRDYIPAVLTDRIVGLCDEVSSVTWNSPSSIIRFVSVDMLFVSASAAAFIMFAIVYYDHDDDVHCMT